MPEITVLVRRLWRSTPEPIRAIGRRIPGVRALAGQVRKRAEAVAGHQEIYDAAYYRERDAAASAEAIATTIVEDLRPNRILDVGCGTGDLLMALRRHGVEGVGLELSEAALAICRERDLAVRRFDLEEEVPNDPIVADVVVSTEVAEHLPEACADRYVDLLTTPRTTVVLTAAPPGQGGTDHVNEQPPEYWIEKFRRRGFALDALRTRRWAKRWRDAGAQPWYSENVLIFEPEASGA